MELPGHVGIALAGYAPVAYLAIRRGRTHRAWLGLAVVLALSMAPDVDLYVAGVAHRGVTHTAWAVLLAGAVVALAATLVAPARSVTRPDRARFGAIVGGVGVASHLVGDVLTPMGIRPLLPLTETTYTLSLVYAADQRANLTLLLAGVVIFAVAIDRARSVGPATSPTAPMETDGGTERCDTGGTE